jgi:hypothetical protein
MLNSYLVSHLCCYVNKQISDILIFEYNYTYTTRAGQVDKELVQMMSENCNATTTATTAKRKPNLSLSRVYTPHHHAKRGQMSYLRLEVAKAKASLVDDFDQGWLIMIRGLKPMKVHDCRCNISEAGICEVCTEPDTRCKPRASYCDWNLQTDSCDQERTESPAYGLTPNIVSTELTGFSVCEVRVWTFPSLSRSGFPDLSLFAMSSALPWSAVSTKMPPTCSTASRMI